MVREGLIKPASQWDIVHVAHISTEWLSPLSIPSPAVIPTPLQVQMIRCVMLLLPDENRCALHHLLSFLGAITEKSEINQVRVWGEGGGGRDVLVV